MYENWEKDIFNIINIGGISNENVKSRKQEIKQEFEKNKNDILYEYTWRRLRSDNNNYSGTYEQICNQVAKKILDYLEKEKAIVELMSENYMYPIGEIQQTSFNYNFEFRIQGAGMTTSGSRDVCIRTIPYEYFRKL